jgi:hypothetical protein
VDCNPYSGKWNLLHSDSARWTPPTPPMPPSSPSIAPT